jgi:hypothetical protein
MKPELESLMLRWFRLEQKKIAAYAVVEDAQAKLRALIHDQENVHDSIEDLVVDSDVTGLVVDGKYIAVIPFTNDNGVRIDIIEFNEPLRKEEP